jgi:hypothetical protein
MPKSIIGAWRGFSLAKQADIQTPAAVDTLLYFEGEPMEPEIDTFYVNDSEITGELLPTVARALNKKIKRGINFKLLILHVVKVTC